MVLLSGSFAHWPSSKGVENGVLVGMMCSRTWSIRTTAWALGEEERAPPQKRPAERVRIQTEELPLGVKRTSERWPVCLVLA